MTSSRERRISCDELKVLVFPCRQCGAEYARDITNEKQREGSASSSLTCTFCEGVFDSSFQQALRTFWTWYTQVQNSGQPCSFRLQEREAP